MTLSFQTDSYKAGQTVQTQIRLLFAIPFESFGQNILWFGLFVWI